jgi:hypothetical protein
MNASNIALLPPQSPALPTRRPVTIHRCLATLCVSLLLLAMVGEGRARPISKWEVFEKKFYSTRSYENPPQEVRLTAQFISPDGKTNRVHGFWDGGTRWVIRFSPDQLGDWSYVTECSDPRNTGLHGKSGEFLCMVQSLSSDLQRHGGLRVPRGSATFEHADRTPFFWTADNVWDGALKASRKEWARYVEARAGQGFNVGVWRAAPGTDHKGKPAFTGVAPVQIDPGVLRRLDERISVMNRAGLIAAIAPLWEIGLPDEELLPEDQVIVLLRQMVGRWDAHNVAWILAFEADTDGRRAARWRRIGRSVFDQVKHSPVILFCGATHWALNGFASETWVNAVGFQSSNDVSEEGTLWLSRGPISRLWARPPYRPLLNLVPASEAGLAADDQRIGTSQTVEAISRSLFVAPPAGVCYQSRATANWDATVDTNTVAITGEEMTEWQKSLYLPGAARMGQIRELMESHEFYRLLPASASLLKAAPSEQTPGRPLSALATPRRDHLVLFVPEGATAALPSGELRPELKGTYLSLSTGTQVPAEAASEGELTLYRAPGAGNWLLFLGPAAE